MSNLFNRRCGCNECTQKIPTTGVTVTTGTLVTFNIPVTSFADYGYYKLLLEPKMLAITGTELVSISDGTNTYPLIDKAGNMARAGRLFEKCGCDEKQFKSICVRFGADGMPVGIPHFTIITCMNLDMFFTPTSSIVPPPATATTP